MIETVWRFLVERRGWVYLAFFAALGVYEVLIGRIGAGVLDFLVGVAMVIIIRWLGEVDTQEARRDKYAPEPLEKAPEAPPASVNTYATQANMYAQAIERPWDDSLERHRRQCEICNGAADEGEE